MRLLHTADWHLGKMFYGDYLTEDQAYVLEQQFLPMVREEKPDAVILAGDVYDRSLPPAEAVELFDYIATQLIDCLHVPFFVISGNHDSAARLSFASRLLEQQGLYISGDFEKLSGPVWLHDEWGPVAFISVPFAEPAAVRHFLADPAIHDHEQALAGMLAYQGKGVTGGARSVCIAHAFIAGSTSCESERPLSIGGSDAVRAQLFAPYAYTALGHLHGPQQAAGSPAIRYAGSLLKYSFGEATQKKGAVLVDIDAHGAATSSFLPFSPRHDVRIIEGRFDAIMAGHDDRCDDFVLVRLTDEEPILDGMAKLRQKYCRTLALETPNRQYAAAQGRSFDVRRTTERQLFAHFADAMRPERPFSEAEQAGMDSLWQELLKEEGDGLL